MYLCMYVYRYRMYARMYMVYFNYFRANLDGTQLIIPQRVRRLEVIYSLGVVYIYLNLSPFQISTHTPCIMLSSSHSRNI